jgi:hypothetical protein
LIALRGFDGGIRRRFVLRFDRFQVKVEIVDVRCVLKPIKYYGPHAFILPLVFRYFSIPIGFGIENLLVLGLLFQVGVGLV